MMNRKGVTPVVATSLLILIAVSAVSAAAVFLRDTTDDVTEGVNDRLSEQERIEGTSISVERGFNNSAGNVTLRVRNTGEYVVVVEDDDTGPDDNKRWTLYVDGRPQEWNYTTMSDPNNFGLDSGETVSIDTGVKYPSSGNYKRFEINGRYETESGLICSNGGNDENC